MALDRRLVEFFGFPFHDAQRPSGTAGQTCTEAIAETLAYHLRLSSLYFDDSLSASGCAFSTASAKRFVNVDNLSLRQFGTLLNDRSISYHIDFGSLVFTNIACETTIYHRMTSSISFASGSLGWDENETNVYCPSVNSAFC